MLGPSCLVVKSTASRFAFRGRWDFDWISNLEKPRLGSTVDPLPNTFDNLIRLRYITNHSIPDARNVLIQILLAGSVRAT